MTRTMARVFDAVSEAGPSGITVREVNDVVFDGRVTPNNIRLHFSLINRRLRETSDMRIKGNTPSRGCFCLVRCA